ncbi:MAG: hypothetical protein PVH89_00890 [Gammaproteobacteria bacterium]
MANKPTEPPSKRPQDSTLEDTAWLSLSRSDRKKLNMDSWEPSLLRQLLRAQDRLKKPE